MVLDYLDKIDAAYVEGKQKRWSRYGKEWSGFSTPMNKEIQEKIKVDIPETLLLKMVLPYWLNRSAMLEIHYTKKHKIKKSNLDGLKKQCILIKKDISKNKVATFGKLSMLDIARMSIKEVI